MTDRATGPFEVKLAPEWSDTPDEGAPLARYSLDKVYHGDLEATSTGTMLSAGSAGSSGVYVAVERVSGTLRGRAGTFALHHTGIMNRGAPTLSIAVVPDSGTGELAGISGTMNITIADGKHSYELDYSIGGES